MENTIKLSEQDYKVIEGSVKKIAEINKIDSVEEVSIKLSKESGLVFFKEAIEDMKKEAEYSGWPNYETWNASLWIGNNEGLYNMVMDIIRETPDIFKASEMIEEIIMEGKPKMGNNMFSDILTNALHDINWVEIVKSFKEDIEE